MSVEVSVSTFGHLDTGAEVKKFTLINENKFELNVISYGATIQSIFLNDKNGKRLNVALGFDDIKEYCELSPYFGSTVGPVANRISNGKFKIGDNVFNLEKNNGGHCLHSGSKGFSWKNWVSDIIPNGVKFSLCSLDKEDDFPGEVWAEAIYTLDANKNEISIEYRALTDKATPIDMTNHFYLNLNGHDAGVKVLNHKVKFNADSYLDFDPNEITVTGKVNSCDGTKYDFREETMLRDRIKAEGTWPEEGYDNFFITKENSKDYNHVATVKNESTGVELNVASNQKGFQFYTGNYIDIKDKYSIHDGFCIETHNYPDAVNKESFPSCILSPENEYHNKTTLTFAIEN